MFFQLKLVFFLLDPQVCESGQQPEPQPTPQYHSQQPQYAPYSHPYMPVPHPHPPNAPPQSHIHSQLPSTHSSTSHHAQDAHRLSSSSSSSSSSSHVQMMMQDNHHGFPNSTSSQHTYTPSTPTRTGLTDEGTAMVLQQLRDPHAMRLYGAQSRDSVRV